MISDGVCVCPNSYMTSEGKCYECDSNCLSCDKNGCLACQDPEKTPDQGGNC